MSEAIRNALTVDVEDFFQVSAFESCIDRSRWDDYPLRVADNTARILDLFDEYAVKATFFVLGWVAERLPALVPSIAERGHEIACHGYGHQLIYAIGPDSFREDIRRSKAILEEQAGRSVIGYRAPSYSITNDSLWALDILIEEGFKYDSSIFPVYHDTYGIPGARRFPHLVARTAGELLEFPPTTYEVSLFGRKVNLPVAGGGYLRLFPVALIKGALKSLNRAGEPVMVYFHPWEIDPDQPRIKAGLKSRFRHYVNLNKTVGKVRVLLENLDFAPMADVLAIGGERYAA